jgi:hypothetical protein
VGRVETLVQQSSRSINIKQTEDAIMFRSAAVPEELRIGAERCSFRAVVEKPRPCKHGLRGVDDGRHPRADRVSNRLGLASGYSRQPA